MSKKKERISSNPLERISKHKKTDRSTDSEETVVERNKITIKDFPVELHKKMMLLKIERGCNVHEVYEEAVTLYLDQLN